jgi:hypothetical protein
LRRVDEGLERPVGYDIKSFGSAPPFHHWWHALIRGRD